MGIRARVTATLAGGRDVIVLGDLNDGTEAATTQVLYGPPGSQPRGPEDATLVSGAFQRADTLDGQRLFNVTKLVPEALRWSRRNNRQNELLDRVSRGEIAIARVTGRGASVDLATDAFAASIRRTGTEMSLPGSSAEKFVGEHFEIRRVLHEIRRVAAPQLRRRGGARAGLCTSRDEARVRPSRI